MGGALRHENAAPRLVDPEATGAIKVLEAFAPLIFTTEEL
ncbi:Uncharacterised protein [Mycobacteroides abscessus subsp. abscessus]|nr:hypothetical protein PROPHIGD102-1_44 [Mycobacterium phage prophiGD102-1]SHW30080.1 Uncharacterised protein [Mycobacteroides abscessus subsp. abscessus]SHX89197.1 Uncharacterised protein [Mycobacteroides abscessus subsp. abscessus]SHZ27530.1 Uncharacterised protein [Mycobacteroides abscessus subsp. abscessus]SID24465.1 Uncharacterised protein [Mycobacteroides abscessus subsp. abscessus]